MSPIPVIKPEITTFGINLIQLPSLKTPNKKTKTALNNNVKLIKLSGRPLLAATPTSPAVITVTGPVGPEHWIRDPLKNDATMGINAELIIPINTPRPDIIPKAAPRLRTTKLVARAASILGKRFLVVRILFFLGFIIF